MERSQAQPLGDRHNFGLFTHESRQGWIAKPRPIEWERSLLSPEGKLRQFLKANLPDPCWLSSMPEIEYQDLKASELPTASRGAEAKKLVLEQLDAGEEFFFSAGCQASLLLHLGITDLHRENVLIGNHDGAPYFAVVDVECIFEDLQTISETNLLPDGGMKPEFAGLSALRTPFQHHPPRFDRFVAGFTACLHHFQTQRPLFDQFLDRYPESKQWPIRVVLRLTDTYTDILNGKLNPVDLELPLLPEEWTQLNRGDVPYFFRFPKSADLFYFDEDFSPILIPTSWSLNHLARKPALPGQSCYPPSFDASLAQLVAYFGVQ